MPVSPDGGAGSGARGGQTFVTDYTVRAITDVVYFCLSRTLYQAARSATVLERTQRDVTQRIPDCESNLDQVLIYSAREDVNCSILSVSAPETFCGSRHCYLTKYLYHLGNPHYR